MRPDRRTLLVLSGGHPYEAGPFDELLRSLGDWEITHLVHPEGGEADAAAAIRAADAVLFYDMAGYSFADGTVTMRPPSTALREALSARFAAGKGAVAMHHALAGWALWPEWHAWLGGQFHYQPGAHGPDSGYRHDIAYEARILADHPVTRGLPASFPVTDELYLCPIDERALTPGSKSSSCSPNTRISAPPWRRTIRGWSGWASAASSSPIPAT